MLCWMYVLLYALQIFLLIRCFRRRSGFVKLTLLNVASTVLSCFLLWYFDTLPGYGIMPGFAYFPEVFYSLVAAIGFGLLILVSLLGMLFERKK